MLHPYRRFFLHNPNKSITFAPGLSRIITFSSAVSASTIIAIGKAFGDDDVDVYSEGENLMKLVFCNYKYEALEK